jgi:hypothetical protein
MEAATTESSAMEAASMEAASATLGMAESGRGGKDGQDYGKDDGKLACHRAVPPSKINHSTR